MFIRTETADRLVWQLVFFLLFGSGASLAAMRFSIERTWDDQPITHLPSTIELQPLNENSILMTVQGKFFNDPANPGGVEGQPFMGLWDFEVIELFLANDMDQYLEIELGPWGQHIVLLLNGVHKTVRHSLPLDYRVLERTENGQWQGQAVIPIDYLPPNLTKINAYAIHGSEPNRVYEALFPVPQGRFERPDFHRLDYFRPVDLSQLIPTPITSLSKIWQESILSSTKSE